MECADSSCFGRVERDAWTGWIVFDYMELELAPLDSKPTWFK